LDHHYKGENQKYSPRKFIFTQWKFSASRGLEMLVHAAGELQERIGSEEQLKV
jgi:hypothetical protein